MGSEPHAPATPAGELAPAARWWNNPVVVVDTETTSPDPLQARILQISCQAIYPDGRVSSSSYSAIINGGYDIPDDVIAVHGITPARCLNEGVPLVDALYEVVHRLDRWHTVAAIVIFNAVYDWPLLWEEMGRTELSWTEPLAGAMLVDPLVIERQFNGVSKDHYSNKLTDVARRYEIPIRAAHDASGDAVMTAAILRKQITLYELLRQTTIQDLQRWQREWYGTWRDSLNAYNAKKGKAWRVSGEWPFGDRRRQL